jgi:hypothetical protein
MARAILWPSAQPAEATAPPPATLNDAVGFAAALGPELTRLFGARAAARPADGPANGDAACPTHMVARFRLPSQEHTATLALLLAPEDIARLLDVLFGAAPAAAGGALPTLPPGSASWATLTRFLSDAAARALGATGQRVEGPAQLPARAAPLAGAGAPQLLLRLDIDGISTTLGFLLEGRKPPAPPPTTQEPELWRRRAHARALDLALPVSLRLAETRMPVGEVATLRAGDILPLERPQSVEVLAGGRSLARLPAAQLGTGEPGPPSEVQP